MILRITTAGLLSFTVISALAVEKNSNPTTSFNGFLPRIECRAAQTHPGKRKLPENPTSGLVPEGSISNHSPFLGWNAKDPSAPVIKTRSANLGEKMDSIVATSLEGKLISKQTFEFTEIGRPLKCSNYLPATNGKNFILDGFFGYEYDNQDRVIVAEKVSNSSPNSSVRYEYSYEGDSRLYNSQIMYLPDSNGDWNPYQKADYAFDSNGNTISEIYYAWNEEISDWTPVKKIESTYDEMDRMTSYFPYLWNGVKWIGDTEDAIAGQRFEYTPTGNDALVAEYTWENDAWLEYYRTVSTFNDFDLETRREMMYWNRDKQDWSGADAYGPWGDKKYNKLETFDYDDYGRIISDNVYNGKTGEYVNNWRQTWEYSDLGDNVVETTSYQISVSKSGNLSPYAKTVTRNKGKYELYYASYNESEGNWLMANEEIRSIDANNFYLGGEFYNYANGERVNGSKEEFIYPADFNPELGYETPTEGRHYIMKQDAPDGWKLRYVDEFTWGPRGVMIAYCNYDYWTTDGFKTTGWETEYDFSADTSNIFMWPEVNKTDAYYQNKTIKAIEYQNYAYEKGNNEWQPENSTEWVYYYSERNSSVENVIESASDAVEIARYDLTGRLLSNPVTGVNIVKYSDGSTKKIMVK